MHDMFEVVGFGSGGMVGVGGVLFSTLAELEEFVVFSVLGVFL